MKQNQTLHYSTGTTPHGRVFIAWSESGIVTLRMMVNMSEKALVADLQRDQPHVQWTKDKAKGDEWIERLNEVFAGKQPARDIPIDWSGTPFQNRVWKELARVPHGETCTYAELAKRIGQPRAVRAVANACARNPIGLLVPCHRVVRSDGGLGGFYWGVERKRKILEFEKSNGK